MFSIENDNDSAFGACSSGFSSLCKQGSCISTDDSSRELCIEPFKSTAPFDTICITCVGYLLILLVLISIKSKKLIIP